MGRNTIHEDRRKEGPHRRAAARPPGHGGEAQGSKAPGKADVEAAHGECRMDQGRDRGGVPAPAGANPEPARRAQYINPFTLLVAVVLSAQATDAGVNKATPALFATADTPEKMVALGEARLREPIKTIGLYHTKAKNVIALSQQLIAEHGGDVPRRARRAGGAARRRAQDRQCGAQRRVRRADHRRRHPCLPRLATAPALAPGKTPLEVEMKLEVVPARTGSTPITG